MLIGFKSHLQRNISLTVTQDRKPCFKQNFHIVYKPTSTAFIPWQQSVNNVLIETSGCHSSAAEVQVFRDVTLWWLVYWYWRCFETSTQRNILENLNLQCMIVWSMSQPAKFWLIKPLHWHDLIIMTCLSPFYLFWLRTTGFLPKAHRSVLNHN